MARHTATVYVQIKDRRHRWYPGQILGLRALRMTQTKPSEPLPGCVVVKLTLRIPDAIFEPFEPEAVIEVPADLIQRPIIVEAGDPS